MNFRRAFLVYSVAWLVGDASPIILGAVHAPLIADVIAVAAIVVGFAALFLLYFWRGLDRLFDLDKTTCKKLRWFVFVMDAVVSLSTLGVFLILNQIGSMLGKVGSGAIAAFAIFVLLLVGVGYPVLLLGKLLRVRSRTIPIGVVLSAIPLIAFIGGFMVYGGLGAIERMMR